MTGTRRLAALVLALCLLATLASGCGAEQDVTFSAAAVGQPVTLDPALAADAAGQTAVAHLYENLMKLQSGAGGTAEAVPGAARSVQCIDNLDGTETYVFAIRGDARWSDGRAVRAADFVYAWQHLVDPATASPHARLLDMVAGYEAARGGDPTALQVTAEEGNTLRVTLSCHCAYFLRSICTATATMPRRADLENKVADGAAGNGAYRLADRTGDVLTLTASETYYDRRRLGPDRLELFFCDTSEAAAALLETGEADFAFGLPEEPTDGADAWETEPRPETALLLVNQMAEQLEDKELRQALSLAIDRVSLASLSGGALLTPAEGLIPYGIVVSDGTEFRVTEGACIDNSDYARNCEEARRLLALSGATDASLTGVAILYPAGGALAQIAEAIQTMWKEQLGLTVKLRGVTAEEMTKALEQGEFSVALRTCTGDRNDASSLLNDWASDSDGNAALFYSGAYDMLLRAAAASSSPAARDAYLADAERLLLEQGNAIPLYFTLCARQLRGSFTGPLNDGMGVYRFHSVRRVAN